MPQAAGPSEGIAFHPLTPERWDDFSALFGPRGACAGCWCMWWRRGRKDYRAGQGEGNKRAMKALVDSGEIPGILSYVGGKPAGWCALAPRETYAALARSHILKPVDEKPVWSVTCFFIAKGHRRKGLSSKLLEAAVKFAASRGAKIVEGYPREPRKADEPEPFLYTGLASAFRKAGFKEVVRRSETRPIMRQTL